MSISPQLKAFHDENPVSLRIAYRKQRDGAVRRNIDWDFTYLQWVQVWHESGRWHQRGCHQGQYVMARLDDTGPYAEWNVRIVTVEANCSRSVASPLKELHYG